MRLSGAVLAGGKSLRMGTDKALLVLEDRTLAERALATLREVCEPVCVVGGDPRLAEMAERIVEPETGRGPLAGVVAALYWARTDWLAVMAVDTPRVPAKVFGVLLAEAERHEPGVVVAVAAGRDQPLCGVYARRLAGPLETALAGGESRVIRAVEGVARVRRVEFAEDDWFVNANTPEEFRALRMDGR